MPKYRLVRETKAWTSRPPPPLKKKQQQKGHGQPPVPMPTEPPTTLPEDIMKAPMGVPPPPPPGTNVTQKQVTDIWEYIIRRARGESAADASAAVKAGIAKRSATVEEGPAPSVPIPPAGSEPVIPPNIPPYTRGNYEQETAQAEEQFHDAQEYPLQEGSGDDDGSGVQLATDEVIHMPQGDRPKVFSHPSQIMVAGATRSGKTSLVLDILRHMPEMVDPVPEAVYWFYSMPSSVEKVPDLLPRVKLRNGAPTEDMIKSMIKDGRPKLMVMDDMQQMMNSKKQAEFISDIFTKISHHGNMTVIFIVQNMYLKNLIRVREQCGEIVIMGNGVSAAANCMNLGRQLYMGNYLVECMDKVRAHGASHPYILVSTDANALPFNVRSGITPGDPHQLFFVRRVP